MYLNKKTNKFKIVYQNSPVVSLLFIVLLNKITTIFNLLGLKYSSRWIFKPTFKFLIRICSTITIPWKKVQVSSLSRITVEVTLVLLYWLVSRIFSYLSITASLNNFSLFKSHRLLRKVCSVINHKPLVENENPCCCVMKYKNKRDAIQTG